LPDRANELAKSGVFERPIDNEDREEIADYQPGRAPGRTPKVEQFISEEERFSLRLWMEHPSRGKVYCKHLFSNTQLQTDLTQLFSILGR
jgi:hypothetical protein